MLTTTPKDTKKKVNQPKKGLHWKQRPPALQEAIDIAFNTICDNISSQWGRHNGSEHYSFAGIDDELLIEKLFLQRIEEGQTKFNIMEIGAGNFQWGRKLAKWINNHPSFKDKIKVSIFSLCGERNLGDEVIGKKEDVCTLYEYGSFKIENLHEELAKKEHTLINQVDLIGSWWTFRHLVDPTGTLLQAYELLRAETGIMCVNGFYLEIADSKHRGYLNNIYDLIASFNAPFYMQSDYSGDTFNTFLMQKSKKPYQIPLAYSKVDDVGQIGQTMFQIGSQKITEFYDQGMNFHQLDELCRHEFNGMNYLYSSVEDDFFINEILLDNSDVTTRRSRKILADFKKLNDTCSKIDLDGICLQLKELTGIDQKQTLNCVNDLLRLDEKKAIKTLNHRMKHFGSLLHVANMYGYCTNNGTALFEKILETATSEIVNLKNGYHGATLLLVAAHSAKTEDVEQLLSAKNIDVLALDDDGHSALYFAKYNLAKFKNSYDGCVTFYVKKEAKGYKNIEKKKNNINKYKSKLDNAEKMFAIITAATQKRHQADVAKKSLPALANHLSRSEAISSTIRQTTVIVGAHGAKAQAPLSEPLTRSSSFSSTISQTTAIVGASEPDEQDSRSESLIRNSSFSQ